MICFDLAKKGTVIFINAPPRFPTSGQQDTYSGKRLTFG